jgi:SAM-dependent methyltransferase
MDDRHVTFIGSAKYWEQRYASGGDSGAGSYGRLADFKAEVLNSFVARHGIRSVVEFGCGDGNQLSLAAYPQYVGLDVSPTAIQMCKRRFAVDRTKSFFLYDPDCFVDRTGIFAMDLALSLDVIYHLIEDQVYDTYMKHLFAAARRFVGIYSTNLETIINDAHVRHRQFTTWIDRNLRGWRVLEEVPSRYSFRPDQIGESSSAAFYFLGTE